MGEGSGKRGLQRRAVAGLHEKALIAMADYKSKVSFRDVFHGTGNSAWLDSMTYADLVTKVMGLPAEILRYADAYLAANVSGATSDVTSAYAAGMEAMPEGYRSVMCPNSPATTVEAFLAATQQFYDTS